MKVKFLPNSEFCLGPFNEKSVALREIEWHQTSLKALSNEEVS